MVYSVFVKGCKGYDDIVLVFFCPDHRERMGGVQVNLGVFSVKSGYSVFIIISILVFFTSVSYAGDKTLAYLDPGIGAMIFQVLIAGFVGLLFAVKLFWRNIKGFFVTVFGDKDKISQDGEVSEQSTIDGKPYDSE